MSSALLSTNSLPEISTAFAHSQQLRRSLRNGCPTRMYVQPPDKGWGWVVVFAAFLCSAVVDGLIFSLPCIFGLIIDDIHGSYWLAVSCAAFQIFSYLVIGPIVSSFLTQNTCRQFVCGGSIVATSGFVFSALMSAELPSEYYFFIILTLGVAVGSGLGCIYISSILAVNCFFVRHRIAATTIALSGSGVGMTVFPPLIAHLTQNLDFYDSMFYFGAISIQTVLLGLLIWPLSELPPGCDLQAGQLPREKDIFDYIRERVGYSKSEGSHESDISLNTRQDRVKRARARRISRLRNESECETQWSSRVVSERSTDSPQPSNSIHAAMSPIRDFLSRQRLRKSNSKTMPSSGTGSDVPSPSPVSSQSGPGTPIMHPYKTAPGLLSNDVTVSMAPPLHASSRRQSTVPDQVFSVAASLNSNSIPNVLTDVPSIAGGVSLMENISVITDLGRRLDECSEVSEFFLVLDPQGTPSKNSLSVIHNPRNKSVSECIHPNGTAGGFISGESFTPTDILPPSQFSSGGDSSREIDIANGSLANNDFSVDFVVGSVPDEDVMAAILLQHEPLAATTVDSSATTDKKDTEPESMGSKLPTVQEGEVTPNEGLLKAVNAATGNEESGMTRIDSDIADLPQLVENGTQSVNKRLYRRQSSNRSARLAVLRQKSSQKGEQRAAEAAASSNGATSDAILQLLLNEQTARSTSFNGSDDVSVGNSSIVRMNSNETTTSKLANGQVAVAPSTPSTTAPVANGQVSQALSPPSPCSCLFNLCDVRLLMQQPKFTVLCLANAFAMAGIFVPLLFYPLRIIWMYGLQPTLFPENSVADIVLSSIQNARTKAGFIVAVAGALGCVARLGVVVGTEIRRSNPLITTCIAFFIQSIVAVLSPLITDFAVLCVMIGLFSVSTELFVSMTTSIIRWSFQPSGSFEGPCNAATVNAAFSLLTIIRAFAAVCGLVIAGLLFSLDDPQGSCLLVLPFSPYRQFGVELPMHPQRCDDAFANLMYYSGSVFFMSFLVHAVLLIYFFVRRCKQNNVSQNESTASNGMIL